MVKKILQWLAAIFLSSAAMTPPSGPLNVRDFGAVGDGLADDTVAIQQAIDTAKAGSNRVVWLPPGSYRVTRRLNCEIAKWADGGLRIIGSGYGQPVNNTVILDELTEPYTVFDCSGDTNGSIENLTISTDNRHGTQSVGAILVSQGATGNAEGGQRFMVRNITIWGTGDCPRCAAIAMPGVDEEHIENVQTSGGSIVVGWGLGRSTAVVSKDYDLGALLPNPNTTRVYLENVGAGGDYVPALQLTGSADYSIVQSYFGLTHAGSAGVIVEVSSPTGISGSAQNNIHWLGSRTENQTTNAQALDANGKPYCATHPTATGCRVTALLFTAASSGGVISGSLCTDRQGHSIGTLPSKMLIIENYYAFDNECGGSENFSIGAHAYLLNDNFFVGASSPAIGSFDRTAVWKNSNLHLSSGVAYTAASVIAALPAGSTGLFTRGDEERIFAGMNISGSLHINGTVGVTSNTCSQWTNGICTRP